MFLLLFEDLTVPLSGFYGIDRTKFSLKKSSLYFSKPIYHLPLMISHIPKTGIYLSLSNGPFSSPNSPSPFLIFSTPAFLKLQRVRS